MSKELTKEEVLEELDNFLDDDQFDDIETETLIASHSVLGFCVYHQSNISDKEVSQRFRVQVYGNSFYCDFGKELKPLLKGLFSKYG